MFKVHIIGMGVGNKGLLTAEACEIIERCRVLVGDKRFLAKYENTDKILHSATRASMVKEIVGQYPQENIGVLVSGDVGFYSLAKTVLAAIDVPAKLYCGINSLQYFASRLQVPWQDAALVSLHGRQANFLAKLREQGRVFLLTGGDYTVDKVCLELQQYGLGDVQVDIGERLSYPDERIVQGVADDFVDSKFDDLSVMLLVSNAAVRQISAHGIADEEFIRDKAPMTKQEVRAVSLSKLGIGKSDIIYDIGAGTGSVAIEAALLASEGHVYAIERVLDATKLIEQNMRKFQVQNLTIINAYAPEGMVNLPVPNKVFIGGSGGNMGQILDSIYKLNANAVVVINCITMESISECVEYYKDKKDYMTEFTHMAVARSRKVGAYNMMMGANPVYVVQVTKV